MINLQHGIVYQGKNWKKEFELEYWTSKEKDRIQANEKIKGFITEVFEEVARDGIDKTITKENLKRIYDKHCTNVTKM